MMVRECANCSGSVPSFTPSDRLQSLFAGTRANRALELRGAQAMKKAAVHGCAVERSERAAVGVGKNGFGAKLSATSRSRRAISSSASSQEMRSKAFGGSAGIRTFGDAFLPHRIEYAIGRINPVKVLGDLGAKKSTCNRMRGISLDLVARPSSIVISTPQASGQSCGQAAWTVDGIVTHYSDGNYSRTAF